MMGISGRSNKFYMGWPSRGKRSMWGGLYLFTEECENPLYVKGVNKLSTKTLSNYLLYNHLF